MLFYLQLPIFARINLFPFKTFIRMHTHTHLRLNFFNANLINPIIISTIFPNYPYLNTYLYGIKV